MTGADYAAEVLDKIAKCSTKYPNHQLHFETQACALYANAVIVDRKNKDQEERNKDASQLFNWSVFCIVSLSALQLKTPSVVPPYRSA